MDDNTKNEINNALKALRTILSIGIVFMILGWAISSVVGLFGGSIEIMQVVAILVLFAVVVSLIAVLIAFAKK